MFDRGSFSVAGPMACNSLPDYLRDPARSFDSFHRHSKTFSFLVLLAYTVHYRLCDYLLYKSTLDTVTVISSVLKLVYDVCF